MTAPADSRDALAEIIARVVCDVPGVAFLRPGVVDLLRGSTRSTLPRGTTARAGVRLNRPDPATPWHVDVQVVIQRGHRALDVARAVHDAALHAMSEAGPARVTVTVASAV
ncbi:Asp23/Gls24 family envelope stress response protein [Streptomyces rochei]|uniref:Asp23/Gls24 family envelope stress response protein n=1 Tax=Streptomyces rochei TaxID=1928 RepID=A0ABW7ECI2_STRRO